MSWVRPSPAQPVVDLDAGVYLSTDEIRVCTSPGNPPCSITCCPQCYAHDVPIAHPCRDITAGMGWGCAENCRVCAVQPPAGTSLSITSHHPWHSSLPSSLVQVFTFLCPRPLPLLEITPFWNPLFFSIPCPHSLFIVQNHNMMCSQPPNCKFPFMSLN